MYTLKKHLGQHFLHDENMCRKIAELPVLQPGANLLEIGPGGGALTKHFIDRTDIQYKAIEVDAEKVDYLLKTYPTIKDKIILADILKAEKPFADKFNIIGNFPYNISSPILFKVLEWEEDVTEVIAMFQKEVGERIASPHGSKSYGILSVLMQAFFQVSYLFEVHERCFIPPPNVKSGVLRFTNLHNPHGIRDKQQFIRLVKTAFNQRRKTLRNGLKSYYTIDNVPQAILEKRAEQLAVADFVNLYNLLKRNGNNRTVEESSDNLQG